MNWLALLNNARCCWKQFRGLGRDSFDSQRLRCVLHGGVKITSLGVRYIESVNHVFVFAYHNAARTLCVFHCLLPIAKNFRSNSGSAHNKNRLERFRFAQHDSAICKMSSNS